MREVIAGDDASDHPIRAVVDTSSLVPSRYRRELQQAAQLGAFVAIWSPWIIAELNRVLVWRWIKDAPAGQLRNDVTDANERRCGAAVKVMMEWLLPTFELVAPLPPYPPAWEHLKDMWDFPIWAAAKLARAKYVISENIHDYPPPQSDGRHIYDGVESIGAEAFLSMLSGNLE